jgi:CheY-like chemotaxis protein
MESLNILIVDDDPALANFIRLGLKQEAPGFSMATVESGQECLEYLKTHNVDCILSDYQMPGMGGMELLGTLRAKGNDVPFIFITGQGNENVAREAFTGGAADYFTKDWGFAHFAKIVNSAENAVKRARIERSHMECERALHEGEERYRAFIANSSEGILRYEGDIPISVSLPEDEQIEQIFQHSYLAECNDAGARMYGFDKAEQMAGARLSDVLVRSDPRNTELIRAFIRSGYRLVNAVSYNNDREGNVHCIMNSFIGTVENGFLIRAWGVDRDITELKKNGGGAPKKRGAVPFFRGQQFGGHLVLRA